MKRLGASVPAIAAAAENPKIWITMRNVAAASAEALGEQQEALVIGGAVPPVDRRSIERSEEDPDREDRQAHERPEHTLVRLAKSCSGVPRKREEAGSGRGPR